MRNGKLNKSELATLEKALDILSVLNDWAYDNDKAFGIDWQDIMDYTGNAAGGISNLLAVINRD